jgi:hypothetical protein
MPVWSVNMHVCACIYQFWCLNHIYFVQKDAGFGTEWCWNKCKWGALVQKKCVCRLWNVHVWSPGYEMCKSGLQVMKCAYMISRLWNVHVWSPGYEICMYGPVEKMTWCCLHVHGFSNVIYMPVWSVNMHVCACIYQFWCMNLYSTSSLYMVWTIQLLITLQKMCRNKKMYRFLVAVYTCSQVQVRLCVDQFLGFTSSYVYL